MNKITIPLSNGYRLIAEQNTDSEFDKEIFVGIETDGGAYHQDLCIVRPTYTFEDENVVFGSDMFEMLVFGDASSEDYTHKFTVPLYEEYDE